MNNKDIIFIPLCFSEAVPISKNYMQTQQYSGYPKVIQFAW